jgi:hypothetical protein
MNGFPANPTINPNFLPTGLPAVRLDLSGVGWSVQDPTKQFTLVSRRHFVGANHFRPAVGSSVRFLANDDTLHTLTIASINVMPNSDDSPSDIFLGEFTADLPAAADVLSLPYLNLATEGAYIGEALVITGKAARGGRGTVSSISDFGGDPLTGGAGITTRALSFTYAPLGGADDCHGESGDFAIRSGQAALVGTHTAILFALGTTTTFDTLVPHYVPELNALMEDKGFHMRKINPPATSFTAAGESLTPIVRAAKPFTYQFQITNGSADAENLVAAFSFPGGVAVSAISASGWVDNAEGTVRRGGLGANESATVEISFEAAPSPGLVQMGIELKSDGSPTQVFPFALTVQPSFADWASELVDQSHEGDDDGDGISNIIEYACGGDPMESSRFVGGTNEPLLPRLEGSGQNFDFIRRTDAAERGLSYLIESSTDLQPDSWTELMDLPLSPLRAAGDGLEVVRAILPEGDSSRNFYRLQIVLSE